MPLVLNGYEERVSSAVKSFWERRSDAQGVRAGKTLDAFAELITWVIKSNGLADVEVITGMQAQLPGYFRATKAWDVVVIYESKLIVAIELKSIVGSSGKNFNNRNEEALGSAVDLKMALEENAFEIYTKPFMGYMILVEDCEVTNRKINITMKHFKAMKEFMVEPSMRDEIYLRAKNGLFPTIAGISYIDRFDVLCKRLMHKDLYNAACVIKSPQSAIDDGYYSDVSKETSIKMFLAQLAAHVSTIATL